MSHTNSSMGTIYWRNQSIAAAIMLVFIVLSFLFFDKPFAHFIFNYKINHHLFLKWFTYIPTIFYTVIPVLGMLVLLFTWGKQKSDWCKIALMITISVILAYTCCKLLKIFFGRYWPLTWTHNNPALIPGNYFGFKFFQLSNSFHSFPSGSATIMFSSMMVVWYCKPNWRWLTVILNALVIIGLLGMDYHFISDVLGGVLLGNFIAAYIVYHCEQTNALQK